ncbi:MAG TPA: hypothetical protein VMU81_12260 [Acetobacteraceae bacterium]|nr:hypothetical protein [Acetobacteraceae bacterium]
MNRGDAPAMLAGMTREQTPEPPRTKGAKPAAKADRLAREAAALRANLRKRKDQARHRADPADPPKRG